MTRGYLIRRLLAILLVLVIVTFAVFAITAILPGNAAIMILGEYATPDAVAALQRQLHLDQPGTCNITAGSRAFSCTEISACR